MNRIGLPVLPGSGDAIHADKEALATAEAIGYPVILLAGVPLFFLLRWRRWVSLWHYAVVGIALGAALYLVLGRVKGMPPGGTGSGPVALPSHVPLRPSSLACFAPSPPA